jgi:serine/threonine-protein kinase
MDLRVRVSPPSAKLFLDEAPLHANPFSGRFPLDGAGHRLRAEAEGYLPKTTIVQFDRDAALELELEPEPATAATSAQDTPKGQPPSPRSGPGKPPKRKLDPNDPWAH